MIQHMANALDSSIEPNRFMQLLRRFSNFPALRLCLLIAPLLGASGVAHAEGGTCPSGYYPVNSPGVMGCAPIPNSGGDAAQRAAPRAAWVDRWGAIATDGPSAILGSSAGMRNKRQAEKAALAQCRGKGGAKCEIDLAFFNQCAVLVTGDSRYLTQGAATIEEATRIGVERCNKTDVNCRVYYSDCSLAERSR